MQNDAHNIWPISAKFVDQRMSMTMLRNMITGNSDICITRLCLCPSNYNKVVILQSDIVVHACQLQSQNQYFQLKFLKNSKACTNQVRYTNENFKGAAMWNLHSSLTAGWAPHPDWRKQHTASQPPRCCYWYYALSLQSLWIHHLQGEELESSGWRWTVLLVALRFYPSLYQLLSLFAAHSQHLSPSLACLFLPWTSILRVLVRSIAATTWPIVATKNALRRAQTTEDTQIHHQHLKL